jgi:flavin-binding protein dodecin
VGLFDFWKPKYRGNGESIQDAIDAAVHEGGEKIGDGARIKVVKLEGHVKRGWHVTSWRATIEKSGGGG